MDPLDAARQALDEADRIVAFTGAGVSTASGIPDFRGPGGLWTSFDPSEFDLERFEADPARFWTLRRELTRALRLDQAKPNPAHHAIAAAVAGERMAAVITQNIDGLHQAAGVPDERVFELHGTTRHARCMACAGRMPIEDAVAQVDAGTVPPRCPACRGVVKPDVVLFGELLPMDVFGAAEDHARRADVMLVAGSSLGVWPAAGLPHLTRECGGRLVIVNGAATPLDGDAVVLRGRVEELVPALLGR